MCPNHTKWGLLLHSGEQGSEEKEGNNQDTFGPSHEKPPAKRGESGEKELPEFTKTVFSYIGLLCTINGSLNLSLLLIITIMIVFNVKLSFKEE